uniref:(northern house mosquito) hypothetical protein n=1 Tax=Culex pipiens TaxID=7175 RepID=A0A8D8DIG6_CULPI
MHIQLYRKTSVVHLKMNLEGKKLIKIDIKQKVYINTHYLAISTSVRCFIVGITTLENKKNKKKSNKGTAKNRDIHVLMQAKPIIYRMLRHCPPKSFIIVVNAQFHYI